MDAFRTRDHRHSLSLPLVYAWKGTAVADAKLDHGLPLGLPLSASNKKKRISSFEANPLMLLAEWTGLEPATPGVTGNYGRTDTNNREHRSP
jgi:hypothetical protein